LSKKLIKSTLIVGGMTLLSRILGFIRDVVIAQTFGANASTDAFLIAFKIPNFMRRLFAEGAFSQAFTPILSEYKAQRTQAEIKSLIDHVAGTLGGILLFISIISMLAAPLLVFIFAPGFIHQPEKFALTEQMLQITFPYLFFIALTAFAGSVLNTYGQFAIPAFTPVLLNIAMILAAWYLAPYFTEPIVALAWGVFLAGILQLLFQLPFLYRLRLLPRPRLNLKHEGVIRVRNLMIPALFGVSVTQINLLVDTLMASFLVTGSVTWLYYSDRLMEFPVGVFGMALATVILPNLSKRIAQGNQQQFVATLDWALRWTCIVVIPATLGLIVMAQPILTTLFHKGEFGQQDVIMTTRSLITYSIGMFGFVSVKVLASGFYARQDTRTPVKIGVIAMLTNICLNLLFIYPLQHAGLALATSLAALLNSWLLYRSLRHQNIYTPLAGWTALLVRIVAANVVMVAILWWGIGGAALELWLVMGTGERALQLLLWLTIGIISYFAALFLFGVRICHVSLKSTA
jgi:putative peptidoglycan lipid II flippase